MKTCSYCHVEKDEWHNTLNQCIECVKEIKERATRNKNACAQCFDEIEISSKATKLCASCYLGFLEREKGIFTCAQCFEKTDKLTSSSCQKCRDKNIMISQNESDDLICGFVASAIVMTKRKERKYLLSLAELIDRLSILQQKECKIPEHKAEYAEEIKLVLHDIQLALDESDSIIDANTIRAIIVLAQMNAEIWHGESAVRAGTAGASNLLLTHSLNGIRNTAKNVIQELAGGRKDYKIDCLAADHAAWSVSWPEKETK